MFARILKFALLLLLSWAVLVYLYKVLKVNGLTSFRDYVLFLEQFPKLGASISIIILAAVILLVFSIISITLY